MSTPPAGLVPRDRLGCLAEEVEEDVPVDKCGSASSGSSSRSGSVGDVAATSCQRVLTDETNVPRRVLPCKRILMGSQSGVGSTNVRVA